MTDKEARRSHKKQMVGTVVSDKMDKSIVVRVETLKQHQMYKKHIKRSKRYIAHDEKNECKIGDVVRIIETRPISKKKTWKLIEIIERAK